MNLQSAQLQIGNMSQTANIINAIRPFPNPAYVVGRWGQTVPIYIMIKGAILCCKHILQYLQVLR